jgi:hypothetical protein
MQSGSLIFWISQQLRRRRINRQITSTERTLRGAASTQRAVLLSALADLHHELGDDRAAAGCLGTAVDCCLALGHLESAAALCRKMLANFPNVVRAHGTLGFLLMARGSYREAELELARYLKASQDDGTASYAAERVRMTAPAFPALEERILLGRLLRHAGNQAAAAWVEEMVVPEMSAVEQRKQLANLLRRSVRAQALRPDNLPATVRLDDDHIGELPLLDTSLVRTDAPPAGGLSLSPKPWAEDTDLPWMETSLPEQPVFAIEDRRAEDSSAKRSGSKKRRSRAA